METVNIALPDQLKAFVETQVDSGRYASASEYVLDLIRNDERRTAQENLEVLLLEGIESSAPTEMTKNDWDEIRNDGVNQLGTRRSRPTA